MSATIKAIAVVLLVALDQLSKWATETYLPWQQDVDLLPFVALFRTYNTGVAFSMLDGTGPWLLAAMKVAIVIFVLVLWRRTPQARKFAHLGFAFIIAGAVGNIIDRVWHGYVIDMIRVHTDTWSFAVFNVADSYITIGAIAIIIDELIAMREQRRNTTNPAASDKDKQA